MSDVKPLWTGTEWNFSDINKIYDEIEKIGVGEFGLSIYPNQIEVINSTQMLDAYSSNGMPIFYQHWSFGKHFVRDQKAYQTGQQGLAYEIVINSSPTINYLMEDNTITMQALVIAHAAMGHNAFFKNNYLFKEWTDATSIIDYLIFAKEYILKQEIKHGRIAVETWLDSCHAMMNHGVNRFKKPKKLNLTKEKERQAERANYLQSQVSELYRLIPNKKSEVIENKPFPEQPEENLLYFFEKFSPGIEDWQRETLRIVRKIAQYFYPQILTKTLNEGFASLTHYDIMNRLHEKGLTTDGAHLEFLHSHSGVLYQPTYDSKFYSGMNPYALGFAMLSDIRRMCENPTEEDLRFFPRVKNVKNSREVIYDAIENYRDESFIRQWLSPKVIRDFHLFNVHDIREEKEYYKVTNIHNDRGYNTIRENLADQYLRESMIPQLEVINVDKKTRELTIRYIDYQGRKLGNTEKMLKHIERLWGGYPVGIRSEKGTLLDHSK